MENDDKQHEPTLVFGFPPAPETSAKRRDTVDLARHVSDRSGRRVRATFATSYRALVDDLVGGRVDVAWLGPLAALRAGAGAIPVLVSRRAERTTYHAALVARRDAAITSIADLGGRRAGWVDQDSAAGYVFPRALIAASRPDVDAFLGEQRFLGSHKAVVEAILHGTVDVGATFINFDSHRQIAVAGWYEYLGERRDELVSVAVTSAIPHDMIAVRASLPESDRAAVIAALRTLGQDHEGQDLQMVVFNGAHGFEAVEPSLLAELGAVAARAGWRA